MPGFGKKPWNKTACEKAPCPDVSSVLNQSSAQQDESVCGSGTQTAVLKDTCMVDCGPGSTQVEYVCSTLDKESEGNRATQSHWQEDPAAAVDWTRGATEPKLDGPVCCRALRFDYLLLGHVLGCVDFEECYRKAGDYYHKARPAV
jgi:hypothetical protein